MGVIYSATSLIGGGGVTTVSVNLALALRRRLGQRVALVDLDLQRGGVSRVLQMEPRETIATVMRDGGKADSIWLESALAEHVSGVYLLAAPEHIEECEIVNDSGVAVVLDTMRQLFDFVVVDCGRRVDENAIAAWERSDEILYVIDQSLASARTVPRFIALFNELGLRDVYPRLILNKFDVSCPIREAQIAAIAGDVMFARLPRDYRWPGKVDCQAPDRWYVAPASALARASEKLVSRLNPSAEAAPPVSSGLLSQLFGALSARGREVRG
jgi:pilus assembly protein CpaE